MNTAAPAPSQPGVAGFVATLAVFEVSLAKLADLFASSDATSNAILASVMTSRDPQQSTSRDSTDRRPDHPGGHGGRVDAGRLDRPARRTPTKPRATGCLSPCSSGRLAEADYRMAIQQESRANEPRIPSTPGRDRWLGAIPGMAGASLASSRLQQSPADRRTNTTNIFGARTND